MCNTITTDTRLETLETAVRSRGCRTGGAFRRYAVSQRHAAKCRDLATISDSVAVTRPRTWADCTWGD